MKRFTTGMACVFRKFRRLFTGPSVISPIDIPTSLIEFFILCHWPVRVLAMTPASAASSSPVTFTFLRAWA